MADQCIFCLNDLEASRELPPSPDQPISNSDERTQPMEVELAASAGGSVTMGGEMVIACLVPCTHTFHDSCLRSWVERANSCPICRESFTSVNLALTVGGPVISSYDVQDRVQVADLDLPPWTELGEEPSEDPDYRLCVACGAGDFTQYLLICDGCDNCFHTFCVGLDAAVPQGDWFCSDCRDRHGPEVPDSTTSARNYTRDSIARRMGLHDTRRRRTDPRNANPWAHVWQLVFNRLNLDTPSRHRSTVPFSRYLRASEIQTTEEQRREEFRVWQRMFDVAQRQGGRANRFRETLPLLERERTPGPPDLPRNAELKAPEMPDEERAWKDLDKAQEMETEGSSGKRKRKRTRTAPSPAEPLAEQKPERKLKRPNTRRTREILPASGQLIAPSSTDQRSSSSLFLPENRLSNRTVDVNASRPSFLQSILSEVESLTPAQRAPSVTTNAPTSIPRRFSQRSSSRVPWSLSSSPDLSNICSSTQASTSPVTSPSTLRRSSITSTGSFRSARPHMDHSRSGSSERMSMGDVALPRSIDASLPKKDLSISAKEGISMLVKDALKPFYHQGLSKEDYKVVNRNVSRLLYGLVGEVTEFDAETKKCWEEVAATEVQKAVENLK